MLDARMQDVCGCGIACDVGAASVVRSPAFQGQTQEFIHEHK